MLEAMLLKCTDTLPIDGADKIKLSFFGSWRVITDLSVQVGDECVFFPSGLVIDPMFLHNNNLYRHEILNKNPESNTGYFDDNGRVRTIKLKGVYSEGFVAPLHYFDYIEGPKNFVLEAGFTSVNNVPVCGVYINKATEALSKKEAKAKGLDKTAYIAPVFPKHFETHRIQNKARITFPEGTKIVVTEKLHGTSGRTGYVRAEDVPRLSKAKNYLLKFLAWSVSLVGGNISFAKDLYVSGTRNTICPPHSFTGTPSFRLKMHNKLVGKLKIGEIVYYEIVGFQEGGKAIQSYTDKKGNFQPFSYGCKPGECEIYVYRITNTLLDGTVVDISWDALVKRCAELNIKHVPVVEFPVDQVFTPDGEFSSKLLPLLDAFKQSTLDNHIAEGFCFRAERPGLSTTPLVTKAITPNFVMAQEKARENDAVDIEEAA